MNFFNINNIFSKKLKMSAFTVEDVRKTLHTNLSFTAVEQYKLLRTNLDFVLPDVAQCPVIGVTSSTRGEGKSTTSINLSYVLAEKGSKVLLIDGDLRLPSIGKKLELKEKIGLTDLLMGQEFCTEKFQLDFMKNFSVLTVGKIPPNPSELLGSKRMQLLLQKLRELYDYIVIDLPPVNIVSDAVAISRLVNGMIVVLREDYTEKRELDACFRQLELSNAKILGCVINRAKQNNTNYGRKKKYYSYYYKHSEEKTQQ